MDLVDLKLLLLIAGPINPCKYFPAECVISQIILNFSFNLHVCASYAGFC